MSTIKSDRLKHGILNSTVQLETYINILSGYMGLKDDILEQAHAMTIVEKMQDQLDIIKKFIRNS